MEKKVKINGTTWIMKLCTAKEIAEQWGKDGADEVGAFCSATEKTIFFDIEEFEYQTVLHELFHAYASDLHLRDTNGLQLDDIEEIFASMFTEKAEKIIRQAKGIYKALLKLKNE